MRRFTQTLVGCLVLSFAISGSVRADDIRQVPALQMRPSTDYTGVLTVDSANTLGHLRWSVGAQLGFALNPLVALRDDQTVMKFVEHQLVLDLWASLGIWKHFEVGLHVPVVAYQTSEVDDDPAGAGVDSLTAVTMGYIRLVLKGRVFDQRRSGFNLALVGALSLPTGGVLKANGGDRLPTFDPRIIVDYRFAQGTIIALNVGVRIRAATTVGNLNVGSELVYGLGVEAPVLRVKSKSAAGTLSIVADLFGAVGFSDSSQDTDGGIDLEEAPLELLGGVRYRFMSGWRVTLAGGAGLTPGYGSPDFRVLLNVAYASASDRDGDGIRDEVDRCPNRPEDRDHYEDLDGCPEPDNDGDGVCDPNPDIQKNLSAYARICTGRDKAPLRPEDKDGHQDEDGVPEPDNDGDGVCDPNPTIQKNLARYRTQCIGKDKAPLQAEDKDGYQDGDGAPEPDNDGDGVCDPNETIQKNLPSYARICTGKDKAPLRPEDKDGHQDADGVPEPDNDGDGFCDPNPVIQKNLAKYSKICKGIDKCPQKPETVNGVDDEDGCPDKRRPTVKITATRIDILEKVYFQTNKAVILKRSHQLLAQVASVLKKNPWVLKVRVEGHTDSVGSAWKNRRLSQRRARSVKRFLVRLGIGANRLVAKGFGERKLKERRCERRKPRSARRECHAKNRRVVFMILKTNNSIKPRSTTIKNP